MALGFNQTSFARQFSQKQSNVSLMISGKRGIPPALILELSNRYSHFNPQWLLTGEGTMFLEKKPETADTVEEGGARYEAAPAAQEPPPLVVTDVTPLLRMMEAMREEMRAREAETRERIEWLERRVRELEEQAEKGTVAAL